MADAIEFQPYLKALLPDPATQDWGNRYTPTQVELPLKVRAIVQENSGDPTAQRQSEAQKQERFEVLEGLRKAVREHHQVLLIGKPGSGKSTALRRLLWEEAQKCLEAEAHSSPSPHLPIPPAPIPVLIELRDCRSGSVLDWIQKALLRLRLSQEAVEDLLFAGRLLLLFDGLNEVSTSDAYSALDEFRRDKDFHTVRIVVTTRELGAGADLGIEKKLEMVPLTEPQMREFIQKRLPGQADHPEIALSVGKIASDNLLPNLVSLVTDPSGCSALTAIKEIQNDYGFYNYDIAQSAKEAGRRASVVGSEDKKSTFYKIEADSVQIIEQNHGTVIGQQSPKAE